MDASIIQSGNFTSTGQSKTLQIRSDFDWIQTYNQTAIAQDAADYAAVCYWQVGMPVGQGIVTTKLGTVANDPTTIDQLAASAGFTPVDSAGNPLGTATATTDISNSTTPIITTASTAGFANGDIIRLSNNPTTKQVNGYDFVVTVTDATHFTVVPVLATATDGVAAQNGFFRKVNFDPLFYPRSRYIVNMAANATNSSYTDITLSIPSGYAIGQKIRLLISSAFGSIQLDQKEATIVNVNDTLAIVGVYPAVSITVDVSMTGVTAFKFPTTAATNGRFTPAMVVPIGENTAYAIQQSQNILSDATTNTGYIGVVLAAGDGSPAGNVHGGIGDKIFWVAGKSSYTQNTL